MLRSLTDRFFRIDARSLGLFRIAFGFVLLADLLHRWDWLRAFYSNEGVLPNHNHLFQFREGGGVWSLLHAFSSVDENGTVFLIAFFIYACFLIGWHTRAFQFASLVCLVSLAGRNILLDSVGNSVGIILLALTLLLPLGARFSFDSLRKSMREATEKTADDLNDRSEATPLAPASLAGLAIVLVVGCIYLFAALQQTGETWGEGSALYYALHVDRWTGAAGVALRTTSAGVLAGWTKVLKVAELAILPLLLIPVARRYTRAGAIALMAVHGLTFALLFTYGLFGWSLLAATALMIPAETWDNARKQRRAITVWYDDDCGVCLWLCKLLKRLDMWHNITFQPNSNVEDYPKGITEEMTNKSMVVVDPDGEHHMDVRALSEILLSLPVLWIDGWLIRIPGISHATRWLYYKVADNRMDISVNLSMAACGVPAPEEEGLQTYRDDKHGKSKRSPARVWAGRFGALCLNALALGMLLVFLAQSDKANELPFKMGLADAKPLTTAASWSRLTAPWGVWAPNPPKQNGAMVIDAKTRDGWEVDVLTGYQPDLDLQEPRRARKGVLWAAYTDRIRQQEYQTYRKEFRRYLSKGGFAVNTRIPGNYLSSFTAYWVSVDTPPPGQQRTGEVKRDELFAQNKPRPRTDVPLKKFPRLNKKP